MAVRQSGDRGEPQDLVVTMLAIYGRTQQHELWSGGLVHLLCELGFSTAAARAALARLVRRGLLRRRKEGRLAFYEMTERCKELVKEGDERILTLGLGHDWDGTWTVVWHSIPEERPVDRNRLARRLRFLGFRSIQDGIWISPHSREGEVLRVARDLSVERHVGALIGTPPPELPIDELIKRGWDLGDLNSRYERFVSEFQCYQSPERRRQLSDPESFLLRTRVAYLFWQFSFLDPEVPDKLMPPGDARRRAAIAFHSIFQGLAGPAQRHFDMATGRASTERHVQRSASGGRSQTNPDS